MKFLKIAALFAFILTFTNCDNIFEYSVYQANVKTKQKNTTAKNLELLENTKSESQDFKFAFITDVHYFYNNLRTVINDINNKDDISFVIFGGDIADQALLKEYEIFYEIMQNLNKPYFTVIGNHDYNSNGSIIYREMFGDYNYSFEFNNNKFILFDDIIWESNKDPDFDWLSKALTDNTAFKQSFVFAHIPTVVSEDLSVDMRETYKSILIENNVSLSVHGHTHSYFYEEGEVDFLIVPALKKPTYGVIGVKGDSFNIEIIEL